MELQYLCFVCIFVFNFFSFKFSLTKMFLYLHTISYNGIEKRFEKKKRYKDKLKFQGDAKKGV